MMDVLLWIIVEVTIDLYTFFAGHPRSNKRWRNRSNKRVLPEFKLSVQGESSRKRRQKPGNKRWRNPWKKLAKTNNLSLRQDEFSNGAKVFGKYRKHHLTLKGSGSNDNAYTRLAVTKNSQALNNVASTSISILEAPLNTDDVARLFSLDELKHNIWGKINATEKGRVISYEQTGIETSIKYLQFLLDWLTDIADAYPAILALGGEAVPHLHSVAEKSIRMRPLITQLLIDIANETNTRLGYRAKDLVCPRCLTYYDEHQIKLGWWGSITYYGCRTCHQSREFFEGWVVARLDNTMTQELVQQNGVLRVNWLSRRTLFDFDEVEIIQATDEEVERFAVQVGNDTDILRKPRYQQMRCVVSADCDLSENSHRILRRMFGSVELRDTEFIREVASSDERTTNHRNRTIDPEAIYAGGRTGSATVGR